MGHLLKIKYKHIQVAQVYIVASISVPFRPTTVQMPNVALIETKWITVKVKYGVRSPKFIIWDPCHVMCIAVDIG
jgi:hypothetical protein